MCFVFPGMVRALKDAQKSFMQEGCWLQSVICALAPQIFRGQAAQLSVGRNWQFNAMRGKARVCFPLESWRVFDASHLACHKRENSNLKSLTRPISGAPLRASL